MPEDIEQQQEQSAEVAVSTPEQPETVLAADLPVEQQVHTLYMPIVEMSRRDASEWIVEGRATTEKPDTFGTIFTYEASKDAFQRWYSKYANVREMHGKNAVGKGLSLRFDDAERSVFVKTRVSKGAPDTWIKLQEGVLSGFSVGAGSVKMGTMEYQGKRYPAILRYDLAELSLVDRPACPECDVAIVRADGLATEVIDTSEPEQTEPQDTNPSVLSSSASEERAGARLSSGSRGALHQMRDQAMSLCGCDECTGMTNRSQEPEFSPQETIERSMAPVLYRFQGLLARLAQSDAHYDQIETKLTKLDEITIALERVASGSALDEVRSALAEVRGLAEKIAAQPASGGPVLNGARPVEKYLPNDPRSHQSPQPQDNTLAVLDRLQELGALNTIDKQVAAAALAAVPMRGRM